MKVMEDWRHSPQLPTPPEGEERPQRRKIDRSAFELLEGEVIDLKAKLQEAYQKLKEKDLGYTEMLARARIDELTELHSRQGFWGEFRKMHDQERARNLLAETGSILLLADIDFFKNINDTIGHSAGDIVIRSVADIIKRKMNRATDICSRWGGEEFVIFLREQIKPDVEIAGSGRRQGEQLDAVYHLADDLRQKIAETPITIPATVAPDGHSTTLHVTVSIGGLMWVGSPRDIEDARLDFEQKYQVVDGNMYKAKERRNSVVVTEWKTPEGE